MSPGHLEEIASLSRCGVGCACSGSYNTVFSHRKTCSGGAGSRGLTESFLDNTDVLTDHNQTAVVFQIASASSREQGPAFQACRGVRFALVFARGLGSSAGAGSWEKMALVLVGV